MLKDIVRFLKANGVSRNARSMIIRRPDLCVKQIYSEPEEKRVATPANTSNFTRTAVELGEGVWYVKDRGWTGDRDDNFDYIMYRDRTGIDWRYDDSDREFDETAERVAALLRKFVKP